MKTLFKLFILLAAISISILAICPDYPAIPTSQPMIITKASPGMDNFPSSTKQLSISAIITPNGCSGSLTFFSVTATPSGSSTPQYFRLSVTCGGEYRIIESSWASGFTPLSLDSLTVALFADFDLDAKSLTIELQTSGRRFNFQISLSIGSDISFDANSQFHFCRKDDGSGSIACTLSQLVFEYRSYQSSSKGYGHFTGLNPTISAFYPLIGGSLATSIGSASSAYFGDKQSNPTIGTTPTWDSSNNFVTISAGQFLTVPLPSLSSTLPTISSSFALAAWVKITSIPASTATIFSMYSATLAQVGYNLFQSSNQISLKFCSQTLSTGLTITLDTWQLIGFTASLSLGQKSAAGTIFGGISSSFFNVENQPYMDISTVSVIRIGDSSESFNGQVSIIRIATPGGGIISTTDLCSSDNSIELGASSFPLACSGNRVLDPSDNTCIESCATNAYKATDLPLCVPCPDNCATCDSTHCLSCESSYSLYEGDCVSPCPDKTYSDGGVCQSCSDANCKECNNEKCLTCKSSWLVSQGKCVDSCPDKTYSDGSACQSCSDTNCQKCESSKCLACDSIYLLYQDGCVGSCPSKTYSDGDACQTCSDANCLACESSQCLTCDSNYLLYKGGCVASCPSQTYSSSSACYDCSTNCQVCESSGCLTCATNYLLYQAGCVDSCPSKTYSNLTYCVDCSNNCAKCNADGCKVCDDGYQLNTDKKCIQAITKEEAGSISGGVVAAIACACVAVVSLAAWIASRFVGKKFPFQPKNASAQPPQSMNEIPSNLKASNITSPVNSEVDLLVS